MVEMSVQSNVRTIGTERNYFPNEVFGTAVIPLCFTNNEHEISKRNLFEIYPNPASDFIQIKSAKSMVISKVEVYNELGQLVKSIAENPTLISIGDLSEGIYFVRLTNSSNESVTKRFSIVR